MSMKNILVLTVLMYFGIHDVIQAEIIHGTDIPTLNMSRMVGKWYGLAGAVNFNGLACMTFTIEQNSSDNLTVNMTGILTPAEIARNSYTFLTWGTPRKSRHINCTLKKNSNSLTCMINSGKSATVAVFDVDYDSYMAVYVKNSMEEMNNRKDAFVLIVGRQLTLPDGLAEKVKQSNIYQQGVDHDTIQFNILESSCQNQKLEIIPAV